MKVQIVRDHPPRRKIMQVNTTYPLSFNRSSTDYSFIQEMFSLYTIWLAKCKYWLTLIVDVRRMQPSCTLMGVWMGWTILKSNLAIFNEITYVYSLRSSNPTMGINYPSNSQKTHKRTWMRTVSKALISIQGNQRN